MRKASRALQRSSAASSNDATSTFSEKSTESEKNTTTAEIVYRSKLNRRNGGASVVSLSRFIKKKPRPREIIHGITEKKAKKMARQKEKRKGSNH